MAVVVSVLSGAEPAYWESFTANVIKPACAAGSRTTEKFPPVIVTRALIRPSDPATFSASTRVLVRPVGLDMVEVGGSNPPGPTKRETLAIGGGFSFGGIAGSKRRRRSTNHDLRSDLHGVACDDTRRVKTREASAF